jgi:HEPN domain-containing protein
MTKRERAARRWWRQARRDLESATINADHARHEVACFLSQQAAEKALKAFLYAQGEDPRLGTLVTGSHPARAAVPRQDPVITGVR